MRNSQLDLDQRTLAQAGPARKMVLGPDVNATTGALYGLCAGLCWVAASYGISYLFEMRPLALWLINGGYHTVQFTLIGLILGAWH